MDGDEELLELGPRQRFPTRARVIALVLAAGGLVSYLVSQGGDSPPNAGAHSPVPSASASPPPSPLSSGPVRMTSLPPWPRRAGACGRTSYLPVVSARPLDRSTGVRVLVSDRLVLVDADTGLTHRLAGLPRGRFASDIATAADGTYALLHSCDGSDEVAQVVRIGGDGAVHPIAHGEFSYLLSGGRHPWGVVFDESSEREWLDPLDGSPGQVFPSRFAPIGAFRDSVVGTITQSPTDPNTAYSIVLLNPRTGRVEGTLGTAGWVSYAQGRVVFTEAGCRHCLLHVRDLATGRERVTRHPLPALSIGWGLVMSPDGRSIALVRPGSRPAPYDMEHPGRPNEIITVDLRSGAVHPVPGVVLWSKSAPGLAFSDDSRWLVIALDEGSGVRLLLWRPGLAKPRESPARLPARVAYAPPVVPAA
jgi:hypothetical protein